MFSAVFIYKKRTGSTGKIYLSTNSEGARKSHTRHSRKNRQTIPTGEHAFFSNGWQSWSYAGVYNTKDHNLSTRLGPLRLQLDLEGACGHWHLLALFNWSDSMQDILLDINDFYIDSQAEYLAREFWSGKTFHLVDGTLEFTEISPHSVVLLSIRPYRPSQPQ
jgi:hypothetical protein